MIRRIAFSLAALTVLLPALAAAQVPKYVNFQSVLRDDGGNLVEDGFVDLTFKILDQDGDELYAEVQPGVQVVRSAINVMIGEGIVPGSSPAAPTGGIPLNALDPANGNHFLQIQFGPNLPSDPMELGSVPYAMYAETALKIDLNISAGELPPILVTEDELAAAITSAEVDDLTIATVFGGDVSGTYNNLQLGANSVGTNEIATNAVGASEIADGSISTSEIDSSFSSWDQNASDDLTTGTSFSGDVSGAYNSLNIGADTVGATEIDEISTRSFGLTPYAMGSLLSPNDGCGVITVSNVNSIAVTSSGSDCLSKDVGCRVTFPDMGTSNYIVMVTNMEGQNGTDDNPTACDKASNSVTVSGGPAGARVDFIIFKP